VFLGLPKQPGMRVIGCAFPFILFVFPEKGKSVYRQLQVYPELWGSISDFVYQLTLSDRYKFHAATEN